MKRLIRNILTAITAILLFAPCLSGAERRDSVIVSLITCWPGSEVYELCGHEAIRVRGENIDSIWNYGTFDFNRPGFVYRFVKGETDYMLAGYPFSLFIPEYISNQRHVVEQDLNLTQDEAHRLLGLLRHEALPQNCTYRYNYVRDNCATRIIERIDQAADTTVVYPDTVRYGTFRRAMRAHHKDYPWYQFGIDIALGSGLDMPVKGRQEMFAPLEMMRKAGSAHFADGRPLVRETRVLNEGVPDATAGPTPWYLTPLFWGCLAFALAIPLCLWQWKKNRIVRIVYTAWFGILGLAGCVVTFLVFISTHEATSPNILILWLNPLQLLLAAGVWWRSWRPVNIAVAIVDVIVLVVLLVVWPFQAQSANVAFFPMMGTTFMLAATYAIIASKTSYRISGKRHSAKDNEKVSNLGAGRTGGGQRRAGRSGGATTTRGGHRR